MPPKKISTHKKHVTQTKPKKTVAKKPTSKATQKQQAPKPHAHKHVKTQSPSSTKKCTVQSKASWANPYVEEPHKRGESDIQWLHRTHPFMFKKGAVSHNGKSRAMSDREALNAYHQHSEGDHDFAF
jgi:hypothetical protein